MPIQLIELSGTPFEMGRQHGESLKAEIKKFVEVRWEKTLEYLKQYHLIPTRDHIRQILAPQLHFHQAYSPDTYAEMEGISKAASVGMEDLLMCNGYTDFREVIRDQVVLESCTAFVANKQGTVDHQVWLGQTWDMHMDAQDYVYAFRRKPLHGLRTLSVTTAGCWTLVGINEAGIAVGTTNLRSRDTQSGVNYLAILHEMLNQRTFQTAGEALIRAKRASAHSYLIASAEGKTGIYEATASVAELLFEDQAVATHTNHYLSTKVEEVAAIVASTESSLNRHQRAKEILGEYVTWEKVHQTFKDNYPKRESCICMINVVGGETSATIICKPEAGEVWATRGNLQDHELVKLTL